MQQTPLRRSIENSLLGTSIVLFLVTSGLVLRTATISTSQNTPLSVVRGAIDSSSQVIPGVFESDVPRDGLNVLVNKQYALLAQFVPDELTQLDTENADSPVLSIPAVEPLQELLGEARRSGHELTVLSAYRSHAAQQVVYQSFVDGYDQAYAARVSARPGHSEHQTGLAIDLGMIDGRCEFEACFGDMPAGRWLAAHAHRFGYVIRYPLNKESSTGYTYEPWHIRYFGIELATKLFSSGMTYEEYLGLPPSEE